MGITGTHISWNDDDDDQINMTRIRQLALKIITYFVHPSRVKLPVVVRKKMTVTKVTK